MELIDLIRAGNMILLDGAMGTELDKCGSTSGKGNSPGNSEAVLEIRRRYAQCGCHILTTNTLTMNRIYLETHHLSVGVREVNRAGAELAKKAAGENQYVLGDMSCTGQLLEPYGAYQESEFYDTFQEQAEILARAGVNGFIIETIFDLREALCALRACKENFPLPVIVSMAFTSETKGGRTMMGNTAEECARKLADAGADVIGANCGDLDPSQMAVVVSLLKTATHLPILAQPNAGKPKLVSEQTVFDMSPEDSASGIVECLDAGARLVGGCCGTSPQHIRVLARVLEER